MDNRSKIRRRNTGQRHIRYFQQNFPKLQKESIKVQEAYRIRKEIPQHNNKNTKCTEQEKH